MTDKKSDRILRMKETSQIVNYRPSTIYGLISQGKFPKPTKIVPGGRAAGWSEIQIYKWIEERFGVDKP